MENLPSTIDFCVLIKISKTSYLNDIQSGKLYMNNLKYFVDLEKSTGKQGIGDIREASLCNIKKHKLFIRIDDEEPKEIDIGPPPGIIYDSDALHHSVFCMMGKTIVLEKETSSQYVGTLKISEDELADFLDADDSCSALVIYNAYEFIRRIEEAAHAQKLAGKAGIVTYRDLRFPNFVDGEWMLDNTFTKDIRFQKQSEYRIELFNRATDAIVFDVGDLHDISFIIDCKTLTSGLTVIQRIENV